MPEQITPKGLYAEHKELSSQLEESQYWRDAFVSKDSELRDPGFRPQYPDMLDDDISRNLSAVAHFQDEEKRLRDEIDVNLLTAKEHFKAHEGEYHDQAVADAKADGVEINVEKPKEQ